MSRVLSLVALALAAAALAAPIAGAGSTPSGKPVDPLAVGILMGKGYTKAQIEAWTVGPCSEAVKPAACFGPTRGAGLVAGSRKPVDPLAAGYLMGKGLSRSEIESWTAGTCSRAVKPASCFAMLDRAAPTTSAAGPSRSGFDWGDAGIGAGAAVGVLLLLAAMASGFAVSRQNRSRDAARV
jgi:hypothetical protein